MNNNQKLISLLKEQMARKDLRDIIAVSDGPCENDRDVTECVKALLEEYDCQLAIKEGGWQTVLKVSERDELREEMCHLAHDISDVRVELVRATEVLRSASCFATKIDLEKLGDKIMSAIGDWNAKVAPKLDRIQTGLDAVQALVEKLQNTPGAITPEDQALLDQIEQKVDAIANDADTIPPVPPAPPV